MFKKKEKTFLVLLVVVQLEMKYINVSLHTFSFLLFLLLPIKLFSKVLFMFVPFLNQVSV